MTSERADSGMDWGKIKVHALVTRVGDEIEHDRRTVEEV